MKSTFFDSTGIFNNNVLCRSIKAGRKNDGSLNFDVDRSLVRDIVQKATAANQTLIADQEELIFDNGAYTGSAKDRQLVHCLFDMADAVLTENENIKWGFYGAACPVTGNLAFSNPDTAQAVEVQLPIFKALNKLVTCTTLCGYWGPQSTMINYLYDKSQTLSMMNYYKKPVMVFTSPFIDDNSNPNQVMLEKWAYHTTMLFWSRMPVWVCTWGNGTTNNVKDGAVLPHSGDWVNTVKEIFS
jgi:hypothetical protein